MRYLNTFVLFQLTCFLTLFSDSVKLNSTNKALEITHVTPSGNGKALLLLPYQFEFNENVSQIKANFNNAGFQTEVYLNSEANLDKFRGSFLADFDAVYISTHGEKNIGLNETNKKKSADQIAVGLNSEAADLIIYNNLTLDQKQATGRMGERNNSKSFGVSAKWFKVTSNGKKFNNTWVFINACHSSGISTGLNSFSETFIDLGAAGFNGFSNYIAIRLGTSISEKVIPAFTSGMSFNDVETFIKNDVSLKSLQYLISSTTKTEDKYNDINLFTSTKGTNENFYLTTTQNDLNIDVATLTPNTGVTSTQVTFKVEIKTDFKYKIDNIQFAIDNDKNKKYTMYKVDNSTWQYTDLKVPSKKPSDNKSVFEYRCFDSNNKQLGAGYATFVFK